MSNVLVLLGGVAPTEAMAAVLLDPPPAGPSLPFDKSAISVHEDPFQDSVIA